MRILNSLLLVTFLPWLSGTGSDKDVEQAILARPITTLDVGDAVPKGVDLCIVEHADYTLVQDLTLTLEHSVCITSGKPLILENCHIASQADLHVDCKDLWIRDGTINAKNLSLSAAWKILVSRTSIEVAGDCHIKADEVSFCAHATANPDTPFELLARTHPALQKEKSPCNRPSSCSDPTSQNRELEAESTKSQPKRRQTPGATTTKKSAHGSARAQALTYDAERRKAYG